MIAVFGARDSIFKDIEERITDEDLTRELCEYHSIDIVYYKDSNLGYYVDVRIDNRGLVLIEDVVDMRDNLDDSFVTHPHISASNYSDIVIKQKLSHQSVQVLRIPDIYREKYF